MTTTDLNLKQILVSQKANLTQSPCLPVSPY